MSSKNTKTKTATTTETKKQTAGSEKVTAVPNANTIVEKKMEDKVVAVEKKADKKTEAKTETKKGGAKADATPVVTAPVVTPAPTKAAKKGGAKEAAPVVAPVAAVATPASTKAAKKGGAKVEAAPVAATPAKAEAKTEKKAETKKGGAKKAPKAEAKTEKKAETKKVEAAQDDEEEGEVTGTKLRYFKLIYNEEVQGRYCGKKPKQAANKAFSSIIKDLKKTGQQNGGVNVDINFSIRECTRNSKHKEYKYIGKRQVLENPVQVKIANGDGSVKQIEYKFHNKLQKAPKA